MDDPNKESGQVGRVRRRNETFERSTSINTLAPTTKMSILCIGSCCIDDVYTVIKYPDEDSTVGSRTTRRHNRCTNQSWERGGNASNSASVLAVLGADVEYFGTLADDQMKKFFMDDMASYGIKYSNCPVLPSYHGGTSVVICSEETGSRTIIHSNGTLPELTYEQFKQNITLEDYKWIHFEGRNENEIIKMISDIEEYNKKFPDIVENMCQGFSEQPNYKKKKLPISIEVEKQIETISVLLPFADVAFIGKDYAMMKGASDCMQAAIIFSKQLTKGALLICPWGEQGAAVCVVSDSMDKIIKVNAYPPLKIINSLGAGDTFNAAVIYALGRNESPQDSVKFGCKVAGAKLGVNGFREIPISIPNLNEKLVG